MGWWAHELEGPQFIPYKVINQSDLRCTKLTQRDIQPKGGRVGKEIKQHHVHHCSAAANHAIFGKLQKARGQPMRHKL
jgi:hypothetical protein